MGPSPRSLAHQPVRSSRTDAARPARRALRLAPLALALASLAAAGGCRGPILTPDEPRSPFDRYDALRDQRAPSYYLDEFDRRRPNLRGRLLNDGV